MIRIIPGSVPRRRDNMLQGRPKTALQGTAPGRVACLEFAGGEKRKTNIAADYAVKALAFTALLCRHIGSIRTFLKS
ncbi:UNVERIFIED_CONTAM: hypothetical protein NY603_12870 [Bacteroidetes bacterium 56_B9]